MATFQLMVIGILILGKVSLASSDTYDVHGDLSGFVSSIIQEFALSTITVICELPDEAPRKIDLNKIDVSARFSVAEELIIEPGKALSDAIFLINSDISLVQRAASFDQLEISTWFMPFREYLDFDLRLTSLLYMYKEISTDEYEIYETYSVKKSPKIVRLIGKWSRPGGRLNIWVRN